MQGSWSAAKASEQVMGCRRADRQRRGLRPLSNVAGGPRAPPAVECVSTPGSGDPGKRHGVDPHGRRRAANGDRCQAFRGVAADLGTGPRRAGGSDRPALGSSPQGGVRRRDPARRPCRGYHLREIRGRPPLQRRGHLLACSQCGAPVPANRKFCGQCGFNLWESCFQCQTLCLAGEPFCGSCGADLKAPFRRARPAVRRGFPAGRRAAIRMPLRRCHRAVEPADESRSPAAGIPGPRRRSR